MYYGSGTVNTSSARTLSGDWDLTGGQSGGPVEKYYSDTGYTALGINRGGGSTYSDCLRIDQWIYNKLMSYRSLISLIFAIISSGVEVFCRISTTCSAVMRGAFSSRIPSSSSVLR